MPLMEYFFPMISLFLLGLLVFSGSSVMTYLNEKIHFVVVVIPMVTFGVIYSIIANITNLLPAIVTMSTLLSLFGIWVVKALRSSKQLTGNIEKQPN
jgi:CHASE2 domain-containing sensor protein